jgi:hypothetical protein
MTEVSERISRRRLLKSVGALPLATIGIALSASAEEEIRNSIHDCEKDLSDAEKDKLFRISTRLWQDFEIGVAAAQTEEDKKPKPGKFSVGPLVRMRGFALSGPHVIKNLHCWNHDVHPPTLDCAQDCGLGAARRSKQNGKPKGEGDRKGDPKGRPYEISVDNFSKAWKELKDKMPEQLQKARVIRGTLHDCPVEDQGMGC